MPRTSHGILAANHNSRVESSANGKLYLCVSMFPNLSGTQNDFSIKHVLFRMIYCHKRKYKILLYFFARNLEFCNSSGFRHIHDWICGSLGHKSGKQNHDNWLNHFCWQKCIAMAMVWFWDLILENRIKEGENNLFCNVNRGFRVTVNAIDNTFLSDPSPIIGNACH